MADDAVEIAPQVVPIKLKHCNLPVHVTVPFDFLHTDLNNWGSEIKGALDDLINQIPEGIRSFVQQLLFALSGETLQTVSHAVINGLIAAAKRLKPKHQATFTAVKCCPPDECEITGELEPDTPITIGSIELKPSWTTHDPGTATVPCKCSGHRTGKCKEQVFTCTWVLTISISAWRITYAAPVHVVDFHVTSPCCCDDTEKEDPTPEKVKEEEAEQPAKPETKKKPESKKKTKRPVVKGPKRVGRRG